MSTELGIVTKHAYSLLEEDLRQDIWSNRLNGGQAIRPEADLAEAYGISRNTVRKALGNLAAEGLLRKIQGSGTFVVPSEERQARRDGSHKVQVKARQIVFLSFSTALSEKVFRESNTYEPIFNGLNRILQPRGYNLLVSHIGLDWEPPPCLINQDVAGVVFHGRVETEFWEKYMKRLPAVGIQHVNPEFDCNWVKNDNSNYSYQMVSYLKKLGHTRIGFVSNEIDGAISSERFHGYLEALRLLKLPACPEWQVVWQRPAVNGELLGEMEMPDYRKYLDKAFAGPEKPTAFICVDDWRAYCTMTALQKMGYRVPEDISITGSNHQDQLTPGRITGLNTRLNDICAEAAALLLDLLSNPSANRLKTILLRPQFLPGETTSPITS